MGVTIRRSRALPDSEAAAACSYLRNGFCRTCDCGECEGGYLIDEWREAQRRGDLGAGPRECACVQRARNRKHLRDSGLEALAEKCTFETFRTEAAWQRTAKELALRYLEDRRTEWLFLSGQSGSGKTHLCTAVCGEIMKRGGRLRYFQYVRDGTRLKQLTGEGEAYGREIRTLLTAEHLYIDDLFKQEISAADIRLAYEILNGRLIAGRPTILSLERSLEFIRQARGGEGEAIAGRIYEGCGRGRYCLELSGREKNRRFLPEAPGG